MENYEQKYKESLERCKSWMKGEHPECFSEAQKAAEFIFPELRESEDEKIRKAQLNYWRSVGGKEWYGVPVQETIAWLEKQANIPHFTFDDILALQCAMKAAEKADNELYEKLTSLHDRIHDAYLLEKQE